MSSDKNVWERLFKLWATICKLLVDGKRDLEEVAEILQGIIDQKATNPFLCKIASGKLVATEGKRTLVKAREIFTGFFDPNFENWGTDTDGDPEPETPFGVYEMINNDGRLDHCRFDQVIRGFGDCEKLYWSQDQIITFVETHANLMMPNHRMHFLFKVGKSPFYVGISRRGNGLLGISLHALPSDGILSVENGNRFVVPQLIDSD